MCCDSDEKENFTPLRDFNLLSSGAEDALGCKHRIIERLET